MLVSQSLSLLSVYIFLSVIFIMIFFPRYHAVSVAIGILSAESPPLELDVTPIVRFHAILISMLAEFISTFLSPLLSAERP